MMKTKKTTSDETDGLVFAEAVERHGDAGEIRPQLGILVPALFHQPDEVLVDVAIRVNLRSMARKTVAADIL